MMVGDCKRREVRAPFPDEMRRSKMGCDALTFYARPGNTVQISELKNLVRHVECRFGEVAMSICQSPLRIPAPLSYSRDSMRREPK